MRILLTNDDGYNAPGLFVLEKIAAKLSDDIWVVAPSEEQSGAGHSLTLTRPVRLRQHAEKRFSVTGTPTDAVTMALRKVLPGPPDLILSGVNRGANLGDDVTYSGTVSAAIEGALAGIRSIALSQVYSKEGMADSVPFDAAEEFHGGAVPVGAIAGGLDGGIAGGVDLIGDTDAAHALHGLEPAASEDEGVVVDGGVVVELDAAAGDVDGAGADGVEVEGAAADGDRVSAGGVDVGGARTDGQG